MTVVLGVDPGIKGALATYDGRELAVQQIPVLTAKGRGSQINVPLLVDYLDLFQMTQGGIDHAFIENVQARPMEGRGSAFKFGYAAGIVYGLILGSKIPVTMVPPASWKAAMKLTSDKNYSRTRATELFPACADSFKMVKDGDKAEAALIAYYGYQQLTREGT